jgi:cyclopropane-fatty-acyl-phospholipid synthase
VATLLSPASDRGAAVRIRRVRRQLASHGHDVPLRLWDGRELGPERGFRLVLRAPWSLRAVLLPPTNLQAGQAYVTGAVDVEGSMVAAIRTLGQLRHLPWRLRAELAGVVLRLPRPPAPADPPAARLVGQRHSRERDRAAVRHHYDVGNDFYRLFLDTDLVYSCAYVAPEDRDALPGDRDVLDRAQRRKLELICRKLDLRPGERLLDVGCGWGSLAIHAARHHGVEVLGITLSPPQARTARERVAAAGLTDRVTIAERDYRDVRGRFDAIASVGMVEHVGADQLDRYAATLRSLLTERGRLLNHGITTGRRDVVRDLSRARDTFINRFVFPDGALVPTYAMVRTIERSGLEVLDVEQLRPHYALTLQHWVANLEARWCEAVDEVGEATARVWRAYLAGSAVSFEQGDLGVVQILATGAGVHRPLDRRRVAVPELG